LRGNSLYDLLGNKDYDYNIKCKKTKMCRYSLKNKLNNIQFNFEKIYLSLDRKRLLKVSIQHRIDNQRLMWQYSRIFNAEDTDGVNIFPHLDLY
jgi:hypothetical protein